MDSYSSFRDNARSPTERTWVARDDVRPKEERVDNFYRGGGHEQQRRRPNRSRSPPAVDRYEPRGRGREDHVPPRERDERGRRMGSPPANIDRYVPGQGGVPDPTPMTNNPLQDPTKMAFQVGFSYFGEWWRGNEQIKEEKERQRTGRRREPERPRGAREVQDEREKEKAKIQAAYDAYKEEMQAKMARTFVAAHKSEQWFKERYVPEIRDPIRQQLNEYRRGAYLQWEHELDLGTFDNLSLEGIPKSETNGAGGLVEKEEGEATAANEVLGVGDLVPAHGAEIRDENLYQPTLLIKTIAPHVSRANLETFCKDHLGEEEGGFKCLSLSDPNPNKRYHRIGWVMLHPASESAPVIDRADPMNEDGEVDLKPVITVSTAEKALEAVNGKTVKDEVRGDFTCHVGVHNPPTNPRKKALWDLFSAPERIDKDLALAQRLVNKFEEDFDTDYFTAILKIEEKVDELKHDGRIQPSTVSAPKKIKKESNLDVDMEEGEESEEEEEEGAIDDEVDDEELLVKKKQLDMMIEYLRRVFNFCFFCVFESDSIHELTRKCPGGHLRRPRSTLSSAAKDVARATAKGDPFPGKKRTEAMEEGEAENAEEKRFRNTSAKTENQLLRAFNWVKTFEDKITQILDPDSVDIKKLGGKSVEDAVDEDISKFVKQEDEHKWRCKIPDCAKLFKEDHFWRKHVEKRHAEWLDSIKQEFQLINSYVMDPAHLAPSRTDANSNGHFPPVNGQVPTGTPRGFNLQSFALNTMILPGFPMPPGTFPPSFVPGAMQSPPGFHSGGGGGDDRGGPGPVRRGGGGPGRYQNRPGPYDRRQTPRWNNDGGAGRGRGGGGVGGSVGPGGSTGGRWGDGAGGGSTMGPREAVQGRSLKSYEDLDHVAGGGGGELNY